MLAAVLGVGLLLGMGQPASGGPRTGETRTAMPKSEAAQFSVTLLTGDRVSLSSADAKRLAVRPAKGREHVRFVVRRDHDSVYVIPADAQRLVSSGKLDRRLFDVAGLVRAGYHDAARDTLPLIVEYRAGAARAAGGTLAAAGARVTRDLPAIGGAAVTADKAKAGALWSGLTTGGAAVRADTAGGVDRIWLDGQRQLSLDVSVPQIGAPAAWQAGFTGRGVTVAVLDSGVDAGHPDLVGKVADAVNFSDAPEDTDTFGHGTHVASIIAGSGAASGGKYRGVAPDATLVAGKVCGGNSCEESAIIAGMQWAAAEKHATAANLSLGGTDTPEIDPLEEAVNTLTAQYGTLFVIAAGNSGTYEPVGSPGSADAALTVGAVDKSDQLAEFSSRGPRVGDDAVKPDLTAPGVDIVAAKAAGTELGDPVGDDYVTLSGTSMATPHVAGSVALLAQQHPGWKAGQFKATLVGSAKPNPELTAYEQGAGRVDVAAAITRTVVSDPVSLSYGRPVWPHDDDAPIARTVTYRNSGSAAVTLALTLRVTGPDGAAAPAGLFTPSAGTVTVPAGGAAEVTVTADTTVGGADGLYSGNLLATAGQTVIATPVGINKEVESYDVSITTLDGDGAPTGDGGPLLIRLDQIGAFFPWEADGTVTVRVPRGSYNLSDTIFTPRGETASDSAFLVQPQLSVTRDTSVTMDARTGKPIRVTVPEPTAEPGLIDVGFYHSTDFGAFSVGLWTDTFEGLTSRQIGPAPAAPEFLSTITSQWGRPDADGSIAKSPYLYAVGESFPGRMPTGYARDYRPRDLAVVRQEFAAAVPGLVGERTVFPIIEGSGSSSAAVLDVPQPGHRDEYHNTEGIRWSSDALFGTLGDEGWVDAQTYLSQASVAYRAGRSYRDQWNAGPFGPALPPADGEYDWVTREGDVIIVDAPLYSDRAGHAGFSVTDASRTALYRDGTLVGETDASGYGQFTVPAGRANYRLEVADTRSVGDLSTRVDAVWTFRSGHVSGDRFARLPLSAVRFTPALADDNSAPAGRSFAIPVSVQRQPDAPAARVRELTVEVSYDDGKTWQRAAVRGGIATVRHPASAGYVSLRASATDTSGNTVTQTVLHAYRTR